MLFLAILLLELLVLSFSSKKLVNSIASLVFYITKSKQVAAHFIAFIFLPGTVIHELSHVVMAGALFVQSGEIEFIPEIREDGVKLGSAEVGQTDPMRRMLIGIAPVIIGLILILSVLFYFASKVTESNLPIWVYLLVIYAVFVLGNTMFSSKKDLEGTLAVLIFLAILGVILYFFGIDKPFLWVSNWISNNLASFLKLANLFLVVPILINFLVITLAKLIHPRKLV